MPKTEPYKDKNYEQKKELFDTVAQAFQDYKDGQVSAHHTWNMPSEQLKGMTLRFHGGDKLQLTYHRYEVGTIESIRRTEAEGRKFVAEVAKKLKSHFKALTGETLTLTKVGEELNNLEKTSRLSAETSSQYGYGYGPRLVGKYLARDSFTYEFDSSL